MPRILVLSRYTRLGASSRLRTHQFRPWLEESGYEVEYMPLFDDNYVTGLYSEKKNSYRHLKYLSNRLVALSKIKKPNLIWLEYEVLPWVPWFLEKYLLPQGVPVICDYDDAIFHRYDLHLNPLVRLLLAKKIDKVMRYSKLTIVGNSYLRQHAIQAGSKETKIIPTVVDINRYKSKTLESFNKTKNIGWVGTPITWSTYGEKKYEDLKKFFEKTGAIFRAIGAKSYYEKKGQLEIKPWIEKQEAAEINQFNAGIMPLIDTPWSRGKCGYKLIQYMACGVPVIASPVGVNSKIIEDGVNGFLVESRDDWENAISKVLNSPKLAFEMGRAGRLKIEKEYSLDVWAPKLTDLIDDVIGNPGA